MAATNAKFSLNAQKASPALAPGAPGAALGKATGAVGNMMSKLKAGDNKMLYILLIVGIVLVFVVVIIYIMFTLKSSKLVGKKLTSKPIKLNEVAEPIEISGGELPKPVVGREYSYSFWVYLDNYEQTYSKDGAGKIIPIDKLVFYRGESGNVASANPIVFMDGLSNKMYIAIKTQNTSLSSVLNVANKVDYNGNLYYIRFMNYFLNSSLKLRDGANALHDAINKYLVLTVDYVPLQRWVNVTFVIDNKVTSVFMDGEIYSVKSTEEFKALREPELDVRGKPIDVNVIVDKTDGNMYIGKSSVGNKYAAPGYLGKLQYFNYAVSMKEVRDIYNDGPLDDASLLGMKLKYGIRSPIYKLGAQVQ